MSEPHDKLHCVRVKPWDEPGKNVSCDFCKSVMTVCLGSRWYQSSANDTAFWCENCGTIAIGLIVQRTLEYSVPYIADNFKDIAKKFKDKDKPLRKITGVFSAGNIYCTCDDGTLWMSHDIPCPGKKTVWYQVDGPEWSPSPL